MPENREENVLRRKASSAGGRPGGGALALQRVFRIAVARAAQQMAEMETVVSAFQMVPGTVEQITATLDENHLLFRLRGGGDVAALAVVDPQLLAGIVEYLTTGRVVPAPADPRPPTRTDAAMFSDFLDRVLVQVDGELAGLPEMPKIAGYRHEMTFADVRAATMGLEDVPYHWLQVTIGLAENAKTGVLWLCMPVNPAKGHGVEGENTKPWRVAWQENVLQTRAAVEAVLYRTEMSLDAVTQLKPDMMIPVPVAALGHVALRGENGTVVAHAKLGQVNGHRALRILPEQEAKPAAAPFGMAAPPKTAPPIPAPPATLAATANAPASGPATMPGSGIDGGAMPNGAPDPMPPVPNPAD